MEKAEPYKCDRIPIKSSVSYLLNNLSISDDFLAVARLSDSPKIMVIQIKNKYTKKNNISLINE